MRLLCLLLVPLALGCPVHGEDLRSAPRYSLDLDLPEETRWQSVLKHWNKTEIRKMIRNDFFL